MTNESSTFDVAKIKADFPLLNSDKRKGIVYLDSASSSQKPQSVIDAESSFYANDYANVARGVYSLAEDATNAMGSARKKVAAFVGAPNSSEIVFTKNATESLNLVAQGWGRSHLKSTDAVVLTQMEHHANIVPWQLLSEEIGFEIRWIPIDEEGRLDLTDIDQILDGAALLGLSAMSNVLGTITPIRHLVDKAHAAGAKVSLDACQYVPHNPTDVVELGADFVSFSGHKMCGPSGVGVLWAPAEILDSMTPMLGGGGMINNVTMEGFTTAPIPHKFEAGTPPIAQIVGMGAAVDYMSQIGMEAVREHEVQLTRYAQDVLGARFGDTLEIHGPRGTEDRGGVLSLALQDVHPHDISQILNEKNVCVRAGHHCAKPLLKVLGVGSTARASVYIYNDESDIDALADALDDAAKFFTL